MMYCMYVCKNEGIYVARGIFFQEHDGMYVCMYVAGDITFSRNEMGFMFVCMYVAKYVCSGGSLLLGVHVCSDVCM